MAPRCARTLRSSWRNVSAGRKPRFTFRVRVKKFFTFAQLVGIGRQEGRSAFEFKNIKEIKNATEVG